MLIADSFTGAGAVIEGTSIEGSSVGPLVWSPSFTGLRRYAGGASPVLGADGSCQVDIPYTGSGVEAPDVFTIEGEIRLTGVGFLTSVLLTATADGFSGSFGPSSAGGRIDSYPGSTEYRIFAGSFSATTVYTDTVTRAGYVKRRFEINYSALTYACYADDVLLDSGSFSSILTPEPSYRYGMVVNTYVDQRDSGNTATVRNMEMSIASLAPPGAFWTDFVFAYEDV